MTGQVILAAIPTVITQLIAFYRIKRFKDGAIIEGIMFGISITAQFILPYPYGMGVALPVIIAVPAYYAEKWTRQYNKTINGS